MNNNARVFLWLGLVLVLWLNYEAWVRDYGPGTAPTAQESGIAGSPTASAPRLDASIPEAIVMPTPPGEAAVATATSPPSLGERPVELGASASSATTPASSTADNAARMIRVRTDVLDLDISLQGGELSRAALLAYPEVKGQPQRVQLFNRDQAGFYALQTGLAGPAGAERPTHLASFTSDASSYTLGSGSDELRVPLVWTNDRGVTVTKTFVFKRGQYRVDLEYSVNNAGREPWEAASYAQLLRDDPAVERSMFNVESYAFKGPAFYDGTKYTKLKVDDDPQQFPPFISGGWIAGMQHHFVSAVVPKTDTPYRYSLKLDGRQYLLTVAGPLQTVAPGATEVFSETLFVGPKLQAQLETAGPRLDLVADYGMLTILSRPLFTGLEFVHNATGNWGWAIVLITALLKLLFYPLSETSGKSMAKMRVLAPRIKNLQDTYKDDREKLGKAMMEMYQREKINPLAGCLPILIQMPVFFAFYWVLLESVEMRQAPFIGWIQDLSAKDPFFILPVVMAGAMFIQFKLNPTPPDPIQAKVFMILPLVMSATFAFFPAGLVLYWVTNTILSIAQQWNINRRIEAAAALAKAG